MADVLENYGGQIAAPQRRPLWVATLAAALTAAFVAWVGILGYSAYEKSRLAECLQCIQPPDLLTFAWWADIAIILPYLAGVTIAYAVSLFAILVWLERGPISRRLAWPLAGILAMMPGVGIWIVLIDPNAPARTSAIPYVCMAVMGIIGGWVAGGVRRERRA